MRRPAGSSALVGSSSTSRGGAPTRAWATPSRCCIPLDIAPTRTAAASASPTSSSSSARSAAPPSERARRWCSSSSSAADIQDGKRNSSAR
jgi:hypothetical protein